MSITRAPRPTSNFYMLDKRISEDRRLSWASRGLLVFLLGKPDHWSVSVTALVNETAEALGKASRRDAVYGLLDELQQAGYVKRTQPRGEGGRLGEVEYVVCEQGEPLTEKPEAAPLTDSPDTAQPLPVKPTLVSTDEKQGLTGKQGLRRAAPRKTPNPGFSLPEWIDAEAWQSYEAMRHKVRKPMTDDARALAVKTLDTLRGQGHDPRAVLEQSVFNSWQGLFAIKGDRGGLLPARTGATAPAGSDDDINRAAMRKYGIGGDFIDMED